MTANRDFERQLGAWLREDSAGRVPGHLAEVLVRTVATRQRRWWSSPRRWLPIDLTAPRAPWMAPRTLRTIVFLAAVALLVAALIALAVGSRRTLPPPFGLARNGTFVTGIDGDLFIVNPTTGAKTALIKDSPDDYDFGPGFSRDGTKLSYLRTVLGNGLELVVADPDGSHARAVSPAVDGLDQADWSPDGTRIVFLSRVIGRGQINVVNADGTGLRTLYLDFPANGVMWLPREGSAILFRRDHQIDHDPPPAIVTVRPDGSDVEVLSTRPAVDDNDYQDITASPDGIHLAYREDGLENHFRIHIFDRLTGDDRVLPEPADATGQTSPGFSPDGTKVVYLRFFPADIRLVVAPVDGTSTGVVLPLSGQIGDDGPNINNYFFTPDGTAIVTNELSSRVEWLLPIDGSPGTVIARGVTAYDALSTVQRLAP